VVWNRLAENGDEWRSFIVPAIVLVDSHNSEKILNVEGLLDTKD